MTTAICNEAGRSLFRKNIACLTIPPKRELARPGRGLPRSWGTTATPAAQRNFLTRGSVLCCVNVPRSPPATTERGQRGRPSGPLLPFPACNQLFVVARGSTSSQEVRAGSGQGFGRRRLGDVFARLPFVRGLHDDSLNKVGFSDLGSVIDRSSIQWAMLVSRLHFPSPAVLRVIQVTEVEGRGGLTVPCPRICAVSAGPFLGP
jgi:hypothetical protein